MPVVRGVTHCSTSRRIQVMRRRVHVAKDRRDALPFQGMGRRDKGHRGHDHLAAQIERLDGELQADGGVVHHYAMADAKLGRQSRFEFQQVRAVVGKPFAVEQIVDSLG